VIPAALGWGAAEAVMPISPNRILVFVAGWKSPYPDQTLIVELLPKFVRSTNMTLIQNAENYVYSRSLVPAEFIFKHLGTRQIRAVPSVKVADRTVRGKGGLFVRPNV
jgi:hypothetical protein